MTFILGSLFLDSFSPSYIGAFRDSVSYRVRGSFCTLKVTSPVTVTSLHKASSPCGSSFLCSDLHACQDLLEKLSCAAVSDLNHSHYGCVGSTPDSPRVLSVWIRARFSSDPGCVDQGLVLRRFCLCGSEPGSPQMLSVWIRIRFSSDSVCVDQDPVLLRLCLCGSGPVRVDQALVLLRFCVDQGLVFLMFCLCGSGSGSPQILSVWIRIRFS